MEHGHVEMNFNEFYLIGYSVPISKEIKVNVDLDILPLSNSYNFEFTNHGNLAAIGTDEFNNRFLVIWEQDFVATKSEATVIPAHYLVKL